MTATRQRGPGGRFVAARKASPKKAASKKASPAKASATLKPPARPAAAPATRPATLALTLYLVRHADAGDPAAWTGNDADRPLSKKGRRQSKRLGDLLDRLGVRPNAVLTSPRVRAADTAKLLGRRIGRTWKVDARLDSGFDAEGLTSIVGELDSAASAVVLVGHDPDFSRLASWLVDAPLELSKGALVRIDLADRAVGPGSGELRWLIPPDAVPG